MSTEQIKTSWRTQDHVVLGALIHDIGKLFERGDLLDSYRNDEDMLQAYCPFQIRGRYFSHKHAVHTLAWAERLAERIPALDPEHLGIGTDHWLNLAARHHKPSSALEALIKRADDLASQERDPLGIDARFISRKVRLEPILERVTLEADPGRARTTETRVPLTPMEPGSPYFPEHAHKMDPPMNWDREKCAWVSQQDLGDAYARLGQDLLGQLEQLPTAEAPPSAIIGTLLTLLERYTAQVPSATNTAHPDISLFDHLRVTAAIAEGLYTYHQDQGDGLENVEKRDQTAKWALVCGDLSGIQRFIYRITSRGAARALRGRSLYLQLLTDGLASRMRRELDLHAPAQIYASGGKFFLLIPSTRVDQARQVAATINDELLAPFQGQLRLGLGTAHLAPNHFRAGHMGERWQATIDDLHRDRTRPWAGRMAHPPEKEDQDFFAPESPSEDGHCHACGRDDPPGDICDRGEGRRLCQQCNDLEQLGLAIRHASAITWHEPGTQRRGWELPGTGRVIRLPSREDPESLPLAAGDVLERLEGWPELAEARPGIAYSARFIGRWQESCGESELEELAASSQGIKRLGILRMDVDNLGQIFARGLRFGSTTETESSADMGSLSRTATLSRQLHWFFSTHLTRLLEQAEAPAQIMYAGGDDLFIVGAWHAMPELAVRIQHDLQRFASHNPVFSLSGGIELVGGRYPIGHAAELAGIQEEHAKGHRRSDKEGQTRDKCALAFLHTPVGWEQMEHVEGVREQLERFLEATGNRAVLGYLRRAVADMEGLQRRYAQGRWSDTELHALVEAQRWRWQLLSRLRRLRRRHQHHTEAVGAIDRLQEVFIEQQQPHKPPDPHLLGLPGRWVELKYRQSGNYLPDRGEEVHAP
ncbi:CRISPR-associated protein [Halorhodospira halochloris]|uniref:CRISPR system single-strand-specific deoxyribonuclease Cas10/Csm1 (subtype III-A) n=1 Tax=Halorhodospira halochloris TaxID=1052 RepID=A0A0X8XBW3_HALHR|nr:type III-A CRISPR-associated protein Cas10/Csm1 [Halorhodospira halochloris]MBK1651900.1 type III-A CRISPR-associated protein Cas10/Csm1 [Halorhodospira halochloris]BAU58758.1 CRISPR-associated protein [Halorhodospira halochloris]